MSLYHCAPDLHDEKTVDADWFIQVLDQPDVGWSPGAFACCDAHLDHAVRHLLSRMHGTTLNLRFRNVKEVKQDGG